MRYFYEIAASPFAADDEKEFGGKPFGKGRRQRNAGAVICLHLERSNIFSNLAEKVGNVIMRGKNESARRRVGGRDTDKCRCRKSSIVLSDRQRGMG